MKIYTLTLLVVVTITSINAAVVNAGTSSSVQRDIRIERVKDVVRARLRDGGSARFRKAVFVNKTKVVCGEVNAKNGFGAYSGFQYFISNTALTIFQTDMDYNEFVKTWNNLCT